VEHCECHLLNPFYIAFPNKELQKEGGDKADVEAMIDYMNKHDIPLSSIPEQTGKFLEGEKDVSLGYWLAVKVSNRQGEHNKLFGYEELSGDDFLFDGNDSFDLLAVDHECGVEASTKPCTSVNPLQDASPSINLSQEHGKKRMQDPVVMEGQLVPQHPKCYCMPKEVVDLSLSLHGLTLNSAMRHIHLQSDASLAWNSRHGHPLGRLISIGSQLKNGLNTWYSVVESTNALPPLNAPYKVNVYPPCIANGSTLHESSGYMEGTLFRKKKDSIIGVYWHIILHVLTPRRRTGWALNLLGDQVRVGLTLSMHCGVPNVFAVLQMGVGPNKIVVKYNQRSTTLTLHDK
jgi:hypothetical protein